ncbi:hypothetical protein KI688_008762 [Linnemannia hyalina]|uniref:Uncharacterized protein n=1 Tax=Linnemannia hyalina TaxID=64524 RepID=A0A9P8BZD0_9FUNG|nr:hypothetical protein KI688_008762 [Linnemannia hyalina]
MKSFQAYLAEDNHNHLDFEKQYTCFAAYLGRQRQSGDKSALQYVINLKQLRHEYDEHLLQITASISCTSASSIVNNSVEQYASDTIEKIRHNTVGSTITATLSDFEGRILDSEDEVTNGGAAINVLDDHEEASGDKRAEAYGRPSSNIFDGRPSGNIFDGPVAAAETGDMSWIQQLPAFTFSLPLTKDWGPQVTDTYNKIKKTKSLNYKQVDEIALLSGILHFDEKHAGFEAAEMSAITKDILHRFYTRDLQEKDLKRSIEAAALWGTWVQLESESDAMSSVIVPILREFMHVQGHIQFKCLNSASTAGENRKAALDQDGQARQPDIVGRTEEGHEAYYGELKGMHPSTPSRNADTLRIAIFTKDSLDELLRVLEEDLPLISFRSVGPDIQSLVLITSTRLKQKRREPMGDNNPFPTLATPLRNVALGIQSKAKVVKRKGKQTMELKEAKRSKETMEA